MLNNGLFVDDKDRYSPGIKPNMTKLKSVCKKFNLYLWVRDELAAKAAHRRENYEKNSQEDTQINPETEARGVNGSD